MEGSFYRRDTNIYEEDNLEASVWDDVQKDNGNNITIKNENSIIVGGDEGDNVINELSQTFANINILGTGIGTTSDEPLPYEDERQTSPLIEHENIFNSQLSQEARHDDEVVENTPTNHKLLLDKLAPEDNDLSDLHNDEFEHINNVPRGNEDPLFSGKMFASPLPIDTNILSNSSETPKRKHISNTQLHRLFSGKRLRRRVVPASSVDTDPLHKAQINNNLSKQRNKKDNSSADSTFSTKNTISDTDSDNDLDILRKMDSPLHAVSSWKNSINKGEEELKKKAQKITMIMKSQVQRDYLIQIMNCCLLKLKSRIQLK